MTGVTRFTDDIIRDLDREIMHLEISQKAIATTPWPPELLPEMAATVEHLGFLIGNLKFELQEFLNRHRPPVVDRK